MTDHKHLPSNSYPETTTIRVSHGTHSRFHEKVLALQAKLGKRITFDEAINILMDEMEKVIQ
jgi:hypothetical protein